MEKEYLLTKIENNGGIEMESTIIVTHLIEKIKRYYQWYNKLGYMLKIYERPVGNWKIIERDKIPRSD